MTAPQLVDFWEARLDGSADPPHVITFTRLSEVSPADIMAHMSDPRVAEHMPLLNFEWNEQSQAAFLAAKEECWRREGLGHWAILKNGAYVGWGGFQKEGDEWDFGLVLIPNEFGLGMRIMKLALDFARADERRIPYITFLLPISRTKNRWLNRLGATKVESIDYNGAIFSKYRLETR